jgi:hypothetical protein
VGTGAFPGLEPQGHEADNLFPSSAEVKNAWSYTPNPQFVFMAWYLGNGFGFMACLLVKHRENLLLPYCRPQIYELCNTAEAFIINVC